MKKYSNIGFPIFDNVISKFIEQRSHTLFPVHGFVDYDDTAFIVTLITKGFLNYDELNLILSLPSFCNPLILNRYHRFYGKECLVLEFCIARRYIP